MTQRFAVYRRLLAAGMVLLLAVAVTLAVTPVVSALDVPPKPTSSPVIDQTGTLQDIQKQALSQKIANERSSSGNQIAILMVKSLDGQSLEEYSLAVARGWGIGQQDRDSGVLLLVAKDDRRLRIEVGYGLEGALPDILANRIIEDRITPQFKQNKYYEGIDQGLDGIILAINGEKDPNLKSDASGSSGKGLPLELLFFGVFVLPVWLGSIMARTKSWWLGGVIGAGLGAVVGLFAGFLFIGIGAVVVLALVGLLLDRSISANYQKRASSHASPSWWAGGPWLGGGGGSSDGFGGFGGGSFGGGGSSGSW